MKKILLTMLLSLICSVQLQAQFIEVSDARAVYSVKEVTQASIISDDGSVLKSFKTEKELKKPADKIIKVVTATSKGKPKFSFTNKDREDVSDSWEEISERVWATKTPGKYWVVINAGYGVLDPDTNMVDIIDEDSEVIVTVEGAEPSPDPKPPSPDDEFDNLSNKVSSLASGLSRNREYANLFITIANRLKNRELLRTLDAAVIINSETAKFLPEYERIIRLLKEDSSKRQMGWEQTIRYYETIAQGLSNA
jgi:hypothetical protein